MKRIVLLAVLALALACQDVTEPNGDLATPPQLSTTGIVIGVETQITTDPLCHSDPAVSGDRIVWVDERGGSKTYDIYAYDLAEGVELQITADAAAVHIELAQALKDSYGCGG